MSKEIQTIRIEKSQTVAEFIETLKKLPQDLPVRINYEPGTDIHVVEDFWDNWSSKSENSHITAVIIV